MSEDAEPFFRMARTILVHAEMQAPASSDQFILTSGLGKIATGLEILSAEVKLMHKTLDDIKALLQQPQRRVP